uniref:Sodium/hydrogen exchanger n=1 Tax=Oncorhynchus tshawytscha TaxID=74940 RepID=A0AAZ3PU42_ONCTS
MPPLFLLPSLSTLPLSPSTLPPPPCLPHPSSSSPSSSLSPSTLPPPPHLPPCLPPPSSSSPSSSSSLSPSTLPPPPPHLPSPLPPCLPIFLHPLSSSSLSPHLPPPLSSSSLIGGTMVGLIFAALLAFITRFTKKVRIIEPLLVFLMVYLAYLTAELFSLSAILSMTFCGIGCNKYVEANISQKSRTTVKYTMKTLASIAETIIFIFLGISAVDKSKWAWDTGLISCTLIFIFVFRALGVVMQTWVLNWFRLVPLDKIDQVVMSYGERVPAKDYFVATTIIVVFFTVMFQGLTIKPLVNWLKVPRATNRKPTINEEIHERLFDHCLTAVEDIAGLKVLPPLERQFDKNYLSKLLREYRKSELWEVYQKINIRDAITVGIRKSILEMPSVRENGSGVCLDLQVIDNVPGAKVEEESETHHFLAGNLYKPRRRYQSHYSRHFMTVGDHRERQDREIFQRNMKSRMETFKTTRHKRLTETRRTAARKRQGSLKEMIGCYYLCVTSAVTRAVRLESEDEKGEHLEPEKEEDVGITFVARKVPDTPKERPKSVPAGLEVCQSPSMAPPSPTCSERNLPWKGGIGTLPVCVSMEATKIIPIDLQQAWNQSISSLESLASPPGPVEPLHPRVSALSRLGGQRPVSYSGSGVSGSGFGSRGLGQ